MERLIRWGVRRFVGGPGRSWIFTTLAIYGYRSIRSMTGRKKIVDVGKVGKGRTILIEHLPVTHEQQLKDAKAAKRLVRKERRAARRADRALRKAARAARTADRMAKWEQRDAIGTPIDSD